MQVRDSMMRVLLFFAHAGPGQHDVCAAVLWLPHLIRLHLHLLGHRRPQGAGAGSVSDDGCGARILVYVTQ